VELGGCASVLEGSDDEGLVTATDSEALLRQIENGQLPEACVRHAFQVCT
jgi:hypothetical protein